jgi:hypothetical protein
MDDQIDIKYELGVSLDSIPTETERQIDRKADSQKDKETKKQRDRETETERQIDRKAETQKDKEKEKQRDREAETERQIDRKAETQKDKETKGQRDRETELCGTQSAQHSDSANFDNQTSFFDSLIKGSGKNTNGTQTVLNTQNSNNIGKKRTVQIRRSVMPEIPNKKRKIENISSLRFKAEDGTIQIIKVSKDQSIQVLFIVFLV